MGHGSSKNDPIVPKLGYAKAELKSSTAALIHSQDHVNILLENLTEFQKDKKFCDLELQITAKENNTVKLYHVHKCILAACSDYFKEKLSKTPDSEPDGDSKEANCKAIIGDGVDISNGVCKVDFSIPVRVMDLVVQFLYTAAIHIKVNDIPDLLEVAVRFKILSLRRQCLWALQDQYHLDLYHSVMDLSRKLDLPEVRDFALRRTIEEFDQFVDSKAFYNLTEKELQVIVDNRRSGLPGNAIIPEVEMFNAILKWERHNHKERETAAKNLLRCLYYHKIPRATLTGYIVTHKLVSCDKELMANIQEAIVADKKRILQRLKQRRISQAHDSDSDSESEEKRIVAPPRPALIVCGGRLFDQITAQVLQLNEEQNSWREVTRIPTVLSHHSCTVIENSLYVAGGVDSAISGYHSIGNIWRYDPYPVDEWIALTDMLQGRSFFYLGALNDYIFAIGGKSSNIVRNSAEKYNIASKRWSFVATLKIPRYGHAGCSHKNMLYISGGITGKHSSFDMLRFDSVSNHWTTMSPMRCARSRHSMTPVRDRIYVIGGDDDALGVTRATSIAIECYTPEYDQWHTVASKMPFQSDKEFGFAEFNGKICLVGGSKSLLAEHRSDVSTYDPEEDRWEVKTKLPRRLRGGTCAVLSLST